MAAGYLRRLVLLVVALGVATALLFGAIATLVPSASATERPIFQRDQVRAMERGVAKERDEPSANGSSAIPVVALVFAGILLLAAQPAQRTYVSYRRPPGSYWQ